MQANDKIEQRIYVCPYCRNMRVVESENLSIHVICYHCDSPMKYVCSKEEYNKKNTEERNKIINDLKILYPEKFTSTEILLKKILENSKIMNSNLTTIKDIMVFYFVITLIGLAIFLLNMLFG